MGETGTGKSMLAHVIHRDSPRRARPFMHRTAGPCPRPCARASCSATVAGPSRGPFRMARGSLRPSMGARSSSMR
jgi:DNA-binding NtrC family response regulator